MQDTEKIDFDNYPLLFDGQLMGYDTETQGFEYLYEMLPYFVTTEKLTMRNDWEALGRLLDSNYEIYKKPNEFLKFLYNAFYPIHCQGVIHEPKHDGTNVVSLRLATDYVINWLAEKMESTAVNNDTENGLVIRGMYETLRPQVPPTPSSETDVRKFMNPYELVRKQWEQIQESLELMGVGFNDDEPTPPPKAEKVIDKVSGLNCAEFDDLFGKSIKNKNELWDYMIDLKMIDADGNYLMGSSFSFIKSFVVIMKKHFKLPYQSETRLVNIITLKIFGKSKRIHVSKKEDERQIEDFLNGN